MKERGFKIKLKGIYRSRHGGSDFSKISEGLKDKNMNIIEDIKRRVHNMYGKALKKCCNL